MLRGELVVKDLSDEGLKRESWGAAYLLLGYISAIAAEVGIEGQHLRAHSQWGFNGQRAA